MGKKEVKNRHGARVGDILETYTSTEDFDMYDFYQVVRLRGTTQVVLRRIQKGVNAFNAAEQEVVPIPDSFYPHEEEIVKRTQMQGECEEDTPSCTSRNGYYVWLDKHADLYEENKHYKESTLNHPFCLPEGLSLEVDEARQMLQNGELTLEPDEGIFVEENKKSKMTWERLWKEFSIRNVRSANGRPFSSPDQTIRLYHADGSIQETTARKLMSGECILNVGSLKKDQGQSPSL